MTDTSITMKQATVKRTITLTPELDRQISIEAAIQGKHVRDIAAEAFHKYLAHMAKAREAKKQKQAA